MKKLIFPLIIIIAFSINVAAQLKSQAELTGNQYVFNYSFNKAIDSYTHTKVLSTDGQRLLAMSYHKINLDTLAEQAYAKLIKQSGGIFPEDYYNYAMMLKINSKYEQSNIWMDKFVELKPADLRAIDYKAHKTDLPFLSTDNGKYKIEYLKINSNADDFGTSFYNNEIVFVSSKMTTNLIVRKYNWNQKPFWNMYVSEIDGSQLKPKAILDKKFRTRLHDGPACFALNNTVMAFTRNNQHDNSKDRIVELQIFLTKTVDGKWLKPVPFIYNNPAYSVGQPFLTPDGNMMYFASNMPGGYGGVDIYRVTKDQAGEWSNLQNLGNKVNTEGDEMYPFVYENSNLLYFTSNGRYGLGGLDIFICPIKGSGFGNSYNAGAPLNSQYDDFAAIVNDKTGKGYFSTNRLGGDGGDDIFSFNVLQKLTPKEDAKVLFSVVAPENIPFERKVREYFPLRNYVFFNLASTEIPDRYVLLNKNQVKDFKEDQLEVFIPKNLSGRSNRQMTVYYNILNILGDRMQKNPTATITLVGSSENGPEEARLMAESVKTYLTNIFGITAARIGIEGRFLPKLPSEQGDKTNDLALKHEGDRRVSIESSSPLLLMEFQSGPEAPLKPVEIVSSNAPLDSYVSFNVSDSSNKFKSWSLEITDKNNITQYFGPYTNEQASIPSKSILGDRSEETFTFKMVGDAKNGMKITLDTTAHIALWAPPKTIEQIRFSIIYEFNDSKAITIYEKYLTDVVIPKIPLNSKVTIHGYTDIIGEEEYNKTLSLQRANDALNILKNGLAKAGRGDVTFEVQGFGEDTKLSQFDNKYPEQRFYNRSVVLDIIPEEEVLTIK